MTIIIVALKDLVSRSGIVIMQGGNQYPESIMRSGNQYPDGIKAQALAQALPQPQAQPQATSAAQPAPAVNEMELAARARAEAENNRPVVNTSGQLVGTRVNTTA